MSEYYKMFRIFGWKIYITRHSLRMRNKIHDKGRRNAKYARLVVADQKCECCGIAIDYRCSLYHLLPPTCHERNEVENVRVVCPRCRQNIRDGLAEIK